MHVYVCVSLGIHFSLTHVGSNVVAVVDSKRTGRPSVYHVMCEVLVASTRQSRRCSSCSRHRNNLRATVLRSTKDDRTHPSSHTNYVALSTPEKAERLHRLHQEAKIARQKLDRLRDKIRLDAATASPNVDTELDGDLRLTITENDKDVMERYPEGSFQGVFWDQQKKAASLKDSRSMKWHPLFIKWCLYLRHVSGKGYEMLRNTKCICLPSQRTLRDYTHYTTTVIGFSAEVDKQLRDAVDMSEERNRYTLANAQMYSFIHNLPFRTHVYVTYCDFVFRYVTLIMDEVHIKDDLVYDKHSGVLVGFENLGDINNHLLQYEAALSGVTTPRRLAKSMLVFMVRGLFTKLRFPYAQFACSTLTADLLVDPVWETISRIERQDIRVLALTCDGASINRRLWKMHSSGESVTYKVDNIFARPVRPLFFISDPPHLLKTTRNCWWNNKRKLWVSTLSCVHNYSA